MHVWSLCEFTNIDFDVKLIKSINMSVNDRGVASLHFESMMSGDDLPQSSTLYFIGPILLRTLSLFFLLSSFENFP